MQVTSPYFGTQIAQQSPVQAGQNRVQSQRVATQSSVLAAGASPSFGFVEGLLEAMGLFAVEMVEWEIISRLLQAPLAFMGRQLTRLGRCLSHHFEQWFGHGHLPKKPLFND